MAKSDEGPLGCDEAEALFSPLEPYRSLILAVSGGADSTALMHLVAAWSRRRGEAGRRLLVITVDHGLRPEAATEAAEVARQAAALALEHRTVSWSGPKPATGIQAAARAARYGLLLDVALDAAHDIGINGRQLVAIVTAHTADDQAETVLMRLARGSGVDGLAAIPAIGRIERLSSAGLIEAVAVHRPVLRVPRSRLVATLAAAGVPFADDPSNHDTRFERVRVREALAVLGGLGIGGEAIARTAGRMQSVKAALDDAVERLAARAVHRSLDVVHDINRNQVAREPDEIGIRLLRRVLSRAGGLAKRADLTAVEDAYWRLFRAELNECSTFTLGGCLIEPLGGDGPDAARIRVYREPDRDGGLAAIMIAPGEAGLWDGRVWAEVARDYPTALELGALGSDWRRLAAEHPCLAALPIPAAAARGLPVFRKDGQIAAAPKLAEFARQLGYNAVATALEGPVENIPGLGQRPQLRARTWLVPLSSDMSEP